MSTFDVTLVTMLRLGQHLTASSDQMAMLFADGWVTSPSPLEARLTDLGKHQARLVDLGPVWQ